MHCRGCNMRSPPLLCSQPPKQWQGPCCGTQQLVQTGQGCGMHCRGHYMSPPPLLCPQPPKQWQGTCCGTQQLFQTDQGCRMHCRGCHMPRPPLLCLQLPTQWRVACCGTQQLVQTGQGPCMHCRGCYMPNPPLLCPQPLKRWRGACCGTQQLVQTGQVCGMHCRGCYMPSPLLLDRRCAHIAAHQPDSVGIPLGNGSASVSPSSPPSLCTRACAPSSEPSGIHSSSIAQRDIWRSCEVVRQCLLLSFYIHSSPSRSSGGRPSFAASAPPL